MSTIIRAADLPISQWVNGAGRKADIATGDGWLLGFAWLDRDAPFSDYSGHDRTILLLEGPGFALDLPAGSTLTATARFVPTAFDGAGPMACRVRGPSRVLNAISAYPGWSHTMTITGGAVPGGPNAFATVLQGRIGDAGPMDTIPLTEALSAPPGTLLAVVRFEQDTDR